MIDIDEIPRNYIFVYIEQGSLIRINSNQGWTNLLECYIVPALLTKYYNKWFISEE